MTYQYYAVKSGPIALFPLDPAAPFVDYSGLNVAANTLSGSSAPGSAVTLAAGIPHSSTFGANKKARFVSPIFQVNQENQTFALEAWVYPIYRDNSAVQEIQILGNTGQMDGLLIQGNVVKFRTKYVDNAPAECSYDLGVTRSAHVVAIHNAKGNELWVNGKRVDAVNFDQFQLNDFYAASDGYLYTGATTGTQEVAINGLAMYTKISPANIVNNYNAGIRAIPQLEVSQSFNSVSINLNSLQGNEFAKKVWNSRGTFNKGYSPGAIIGPDGLTPKLDDNLTSYQGYWYGVVPMDTPRTSIYGVMLEWSGSGVTVDTSLDGNTWTPQTNGALSPLVTNNFDPTGKQLHVRVGFAGGIVNDPSYMSSLTAHSYSDNKVQSPANRLVTASWPSVLRDDYEPILNREDNGMRLANSTLTVSADSSGSPVDFKTLEIWVKPISGTVTFSHSGTKYRNGVADSSLPIGEWSLVHIASSTNLSGDITVAGNVQVGQFTLYVNQLSPTDIAFIYSAYTGYPLIVVTDTQNTVSASEAANPVTLYSHAWSLDSL